MIEHVSEVPSPIAQFLHCSLVDVWKEEEEVSGYGIELKGNGHLTKQPSRLKLAISLNEDYVTFGAVKCHGNGSVDTQLVARMTSIVLSDRNSDLMQFISPKEGFAASRGATNLNYPPGIVKSEELSALNIIQVVEEGFNEGLGSSVAPILNKINEIPHFREPATSLFGFEF